MRPSQRLRRRSDFADTYEHGEALASRIVALRIRPNGLDDTRYGFAVGKRLGNAVLRNRIRRRLRSIVRTLPVRGGSDIVIIARAAAIEAPYLEIEHAVRTLVRRAGLLTTDGSPQ